MATSERTYEGWHLDVNCELDEDGYVVLSCANTMKPSASSAWTQWSETDTVRISRKGLTDEMMRDLCPNLEV